MTSLRGISRQVILCSVASLFVLAMLFAARFAYSATNAGDIISTPTSVNAPSGAGTGSTASPSPTNIAQSADNFCADFEYPPPTSPLTCGQTDTKTGKKVGTNCTYTYKLPDGSARKCICVYDNKVNPPGGVCRALTQTTDSSGTTGGSTGTGGTSKPPSGGTTGGTTGGTAGGTTGGSTGSAGSASGTTGGTTGTGSAGGTAGSAGSGTAGAGGTTAGSAGGTIGSGGTTGGVTGSGGSTGSAGGVYTGAGGNSGVLTGTGAWNPGNKSYGSGRYSGSGGSSAISAISGFANTINQIQSFSNMGNQVIPTGSNWSDVARFQNGQANAYYLTPPRENIVINNQIYQAAPSGSYGSSTGTFSQQSTSFDQTAADTNLKRFIESVQKMSNSAVSGLGDTYRNLSGTQNNLPPELPSNNSVDYNNPVFDTSIAPDGGSPNTGGNSGAPRYQNSADSIANISDIQTAKAIAQQVRDNLEELRATVALLQTAQENITSEQLTNTKPSPITDKNPSPQPIPEKNPPSRHPPPASSSTIQQEASSSPASIQSTEATAAIDTAEKKVAQIQSQLDAGQQQLNLANDRVHELTAELNALNDRIKAGNQQLSDSTISRSDRFGLLSALLENVQLALSDAETRLEQAVDQSPPPTVGHVAISGFGGAVSGAVDVSMKISLTFTKIIQNFWHAIFPTL